ncbi:MAG: glycosyltransferase family 4 protein [Methanobacterium sp.]|jgi:glycosyltransferase involved in cell wall biosynthesis
MRILIIGGSLSLVNGPSIAVKSIAEHLNNGNEVFFFPLFPVITKNRFEWDSEVKLIEKGISIKILVLMLKNFYKSFILIKDYINPLSFSGIPYVLATSYHRSILEIIIRRTNPDVINIHGVMLDTWGLIDKVIEMQMNICVSIHAIGAGNPNIKIKYDVDKFELDAFAKLKSDNVQVTAVSTSVRDSIKEILGIEFKDLKIIPNGVDLDKFKHFLMEKNEFLQKFDIPNNKILILHVASLSKLKNQIAVLKAIKEMHSGLRDKIHYIMVGDGSERRYLEEYTIENKIQNYITFTGILKGSDLQNMYLSSDFFILPSTSEALPLVFLEALASKLPIITFDSVGGVKDLYNNCCFQLIHERDTKSIIYNVEIAIERKWDTEKIREHAKKWTWQKVSEKYLKIYKSII